MSSLVAEILMIDDNESSPAVQWRSHVRRGSFVNYNFYSVNVLNI